jgi:AraC-like DNA-binding protein
MKKSVNPIPGHLKAFSVFQSIFNNYLGRKCHYVSPADWTWTVPFFPRRNPEPWHFEQYYGQAAKRGAYVRANFKRVAKEKRSRVARFGNIVDFFTPVLSGGRCKGFLFSGSVLEKYPAPEDFRLYWKEVTGTEGSDLNPDFLYYCRTVLSLPALDKEGIAGYSRLMELLAGWLGGKAEAGIAREAEDLLRKVFAPQIPHPYWADWVVGLDKFFVKPAKEVSVPAWVREEIGINRMPTVAAALMPQKPLLDTGALEILCLARRFQRECFLAARELPETAAGPLGDYGAILLTSAKPGLSLAQARQEVREKIQNFCRTLGRRLHTNIRAGVGSLLPWGGSLPESYREAVVSLHSSVEAGKEIVFFGESDRRLENSSGTQMQALIGALSEALARSSPARLALARENFIQNLLYKGYGPEVSRAYFLSVLHLLIEQFNRRPELEASATRALGAKLLDRLDLAVTLPDLVSNFRQALDVLVHYQDSPRKASAAARMEEVVAEITKDPGRPWLLSRLGRRKGMSSPTFLKWFRKVAGLPFGPYLRRARLAKADNLLREGNLTLERVAQECGFSSASSFIQIFRRAKGVSPRQYYRKDPEI